MTKNDYEAPKGKRLTIALAVFALVVVPLAIYTAGYLFLSERHDLPGPIWQTTVIERTYPQQWMPAVFRPAAKLEGWIRGIDVQATWASDHAGDPHWLGP